LARSLDVLDLRAIEIAGTFEKNSTDNLTRMLLGYNTNGFAHHDPRQAIELLAEIGYQSLALTVDHQLLNPFDLRSASQTQEIKYLLGDFGLRSVIETGARFLLDSKTKHYPTLLSEDKSDRQRRIDFLRYCIDVAAELNSDCVSLWSGTLPETTDVQTGMERLAAGLETVCKHAEQSQVIIGFEPEPGMFVDTTSSFERLLQWIDSPVIKMTMDIGHLFCQTEWPIADYIQRWKDRIVNIHIEDMRVGVHEHLMFGEGEIDFKSVIRAISDIDYQGGIHVELSRHSHDASNVARQAYAFLHTLLASSDHDPF
jgi:sugar phosphate isomerase/epimerase